MSLLKNIGLRLKGIRQEAEIKQKDLAKALNILPSQLSMYEQGKREPTISFLNDFANFFHISLSQFFLFENINFVETDSNKEYSTVINNLKNILQTLENKNFHQVNNAKAAS